MKSKTTLTKPSQGIIIASEIIRALAHPLRMQILQFIDEQKSVNVNKIYHELGLEQSITSQHLKLLRVNGLVETSRSGKYIFYTVNYDRLVRIGLAINDYGS